MIAVLRHRQQIEAVSPFIARAFEELVAAINTPPLYFNGQLAFPPIANPSSDPFTFDGYREGTWIPTDQSGANLALTAGSCEYVQLGSIIIAAGFITYPATASGANAGIGGLPKPAVNTANTIYVGSSRTNANLVFDPVVQRNTATMAFFTRLNVQITNAQLTGAIVNVTITYRAAL